MKSILIFIVSLSFSISSLAQLYATQSGKMQVNGRFGNSNVTAVTNNLHMQVNYDRAEINIQLEIPSLLSDNDSLNLRLQKNRSAEARFNGKMNINQLQTKSPPKQKFSIDGTLTLNGKTRPFHFNATLERFPVEYISCIFNASFTINLNEFGIKSGRQENKVKVKFYQLVLKRPGE